MVGALVLSKEVTVLILPPANFFFPFFNFFHDYLLLVDIFRFFPFSNFSIHNMTKFIIC
jgi:hypothetical protein